MKTWADFNITVPATAAGEYYTQCPQCSPQRKKKNVKCLSANIEKSVWHCAHCGWSGTLKAGVDRKPDYHHWQKPAYRKPDYEPKADLPENVVKWFAGRGISERVLVRNKIGYGEIYMPQVEGFTTAIQFPYFRQGEVINVKYRDSKKNFRMETGAERILYGLDDIGLTAIIVEGEIDKLSVEEAGFTYCLSVPDGAPAPTSKDYSNKFEFLENCEKELEGVKQFIIAVDADEPGQVLQEELARRLGPEKCSLVTWPKGHKDANEVLIGLGPDELRSCIKAARPYPVKGIFEVKDLMERVCQYYVKGAEAGAMPGWKAVNELYSVRTGEWTVVTGIPGSGKSEFIDAMLLNLSAGCDWQFAIFSPENQPLERHIAKLAEKYQCQPFLKHRYGGARMSQDDVIEAVKYLHNRFVFILPEEDELTMDGVLKLARTVILRRGVKGIVIDPWNELDHRRHSNLSETEYISQSLTKLRRFARQYGVHIWLVAHPAKLKKGVDGHYPIPTPYDISGSAHWRNKADNAITVHRKLDTDLVKICVQKIRFKEVGKVGEAELRYDWETGRYLDI